MSGSESSDSEPTKNKQFQYKWTTESLMILYGNLSLKPAGTNKHLSMLLLQEKLYEDLNTYIPIRCIWKVLTTQWNIEKADKIEDSVFNKDDKNFTLPEEFNQLIAEEGDKIKKVQEIECLNDKINKRELFVGRGTRSKSNSMSSSVDSKDGLDEIIPVTLYQKSNVKINYHTSEETLNSRRSLRSNDKPVEKEQDCLLNRKKNVRVNYKSDEPNQSKDLKKCERVPGEPKSKRSVQYTNEAIHQVKKKARRVTSDQLVVLQSPEKPLGRRSCCTKI